MIKQLYKLWLEEQRIVSTNDKQIQIWVKDFVKFADKILTPKKKGSQTGISEGKKHYLISRDE